MIRSCILVFLILTLSPLFSVGPWLQKASLPGPGRHRPFSFVIANKAYLGGGWNGTQMWNDFWEYDPATNSWTQRATLLTTSAWTSSGFSLNNKGFVIGGTLGNILRCYDPVTNLWTVRTSAPASLYWESQLWIFNNEAYYPNQSVIYKYNETTNVWTTIGTSGHAFTGIGTSFQTATRAYTLFDGSGNMTWEFNPSTNFWTQRATFPGEARSQAYGFGLNGMGYAGCGDGFVNDNLNDFWEFDPVMNLWTRVPNLPGATRENFTAWTIGTKGYICAGTNGTNMQDLWEFDDTQITAGLSEMNGPGISLSMYPNPVVAQSTIRISGKTISESDGLSITIIDLGGKRIASIPVTSNEVKMDGGGIPAGTYLYCLQNGQQKLAAGKFIVR